MWMFIINFKLNLIMEYEEEVKECTCRYCGEDSHEEFCSSECLKAYKSDN